MKQFGRKVFHGGLMMLSAYDDEGRRKYLTKKESVRFLQAVESLPTCERAFCQLLYFSGCRVSEALHLGPRKTDFEEGLIRIETLKQRGKIKTRRIPIPSELTSALSEFRSHEPSYWNFSRTTAWRIVRSAMVLARIQGIQASPKGLRHGFGVRAALAGVPITKIQNWMGHSKVETTAIYLDTRDAEDRVLMQKTW